MRSPLSFRLILAVLAVLVLAAVVLDSALDRSTHPRPGLPEVYTDIAQERDCTVLQETFERNIAQPHPIPRSYADAADRQMYRAGCYGR